MGASALAGAALCLAALGALGAQSPMDSIERLPGSQMERDTASHLSDVRISRLPAAAQGRWRAYVARSRAARAADLEAMRAELRAAGRDTMVRAPYTHEFFVVPAMTERWFATDTARRMAESILSYQAPNGGWSKHVDFLAGPRKPGQSYYSETPDWRYIATIDNGATTEELAFLRGANLAHPDPRYQRSGTRGVRYLLAAQLPSGCWPQVWPLQGGYHDDATFNDDASMHAATVLRDVAAGRYSGLVDDALRPHAAAAVDAALGCVLASQVQVSGRGTVWGQQHDPITLRPSSARSYEKTSLAAKESIAIADFLMSFAAPSAAAVRAVHDAIAWYRANAIEGYDYSRYELRQKAGAPPLWARMYEIGSNRPIFSNRDGKVLYRWEELTDRRSGYGWFTSEPPALLVRYDEWTARHPRSRR